MTATVAKTIYQQLGGNRFAAMTGARNLVCGENYLQFDLPANFAKRGINKVRVTLEPTDTYTIVFWRFRRKALELREVDKAEDVYCDQLQEVFTRYTGLDTRL